MKKFILILFAICTTISAYAVDSLLVEGKVWLDGAGRSNVSIGSIKTDTEGAFSFKLPCGIDTILTPVYKAFLFDPPYYHIASTDTSVDSLLFTAERQVKKVIIISGQSNAEHVGELKYFINDTVDIKIPYYLAYCMGEYGLSTLGLLTSFGKTLNYCRGYNCGFGIEMLLARTLYKNYTDSIAVMKMPYSGTSLYYHWGFNGSTWTWFKEKHNNAVVLMRDKGYEPEYIGIFWFQGESDEMAEAAPVYAENLHDIVDRMRDRFPNSSEASELPFICVQIKWDPSSVYEPPIREALMDIANHRTNTACIDIDDCHAFRYDNRNMHFNGNALNRIGYRLAVEYLNMVGHPIDSSITISVNLDEVVDTTVILTVEGDTSFTQVIDSLTFDFHAVLGDSLNLKLNLHSEVYNYTPANQNILYAYDQTALKDITYTFNVNKVVAIADYPNEMDHMLMHAYPNPFNPVTAINIQLPSSGQVELNIYDLLGRKIATLIDMPMERGAYRIEWDASDKASGMYVARLKVGSEVVLQKLTLLK